LSFHEIEQAYLNIDPVVRVRKQDEEFYMTYKGRGMMEREEYNLPLNKEAYLHLKEKADGHVITKKRYLIPIENNLTIELDVFEGELSPLIIAEVEFSSKEEAESFTPPAWFKRDVTFDKEFHNARLSRLGLPPLP
jgi:CYTH domain-containing protein